MVTGATATEATQFHGQTTPAEGTARPAAARSGAPGQTPRRPRCPRRPVPARRSAAASQPRCASATPAHPASARTKETRSSSRHESAPQAAHGFPGRQCLQAARTAPHARDEVAPLGRREPKDSTPGVLAVPHVDEGTVPCGGLDASTTTVASGASSPRRARFATVVADIFGTRRTAHLSRPQQ